MTSQKRTVTQATEKKEDALQGSNVRWENRLSSVGEREKRKSEGGESEREKRKNEKGKRGVRKKTIISFFFFFSFFSSFPFALRLTRLFHPVSLSKRQEREVERSREKRKGREKEKKNREQLIVVFFTHCLSLFVLLFSLFSFLPLFLLFLIYSPFLYREDKRIDSSCSGAL